MLPFLTEKAPQMITEIKIRTDTCTQRTYFSVVILCRLHHRCNLSKGVRAGGRGGRQRTPPSSRKLLGGKSTWTIS